MVGSIFSDSEKASDPANHSLLINKLLYCGINGKAKVLLESYIVNRYQRVQLDNSILNSAVSGWTRVKQSPTGASSGPSFISLINK